MTVPRRDMLREIIDVQRHAQEVTYGHGPLTELPREDLVAYIKDNVLALTDELHEALGEVGWKPWASSRHMNVDSFRSELIDALHFLVNLWLSSGGTADELHASFMKKHARNRERQKQGYDGVSGKCPGCRRDYADAGVVCYPPQDDGPGYCAGLPDATPTETRTRVAEYAAAIQDAVVTHKDTGVIEE